MDRVGRCLRAARAARGMNRRTLARDAGVSERYLAEIENGKANLSLQLLCRIAKAMDLEPLHLLQNRERRPAPALDTFLARLTARQQAEALTLLNRHFGRHFGPEPRPCCGIALIGLRGAGKSSLGMALAKRRNRPFLRLGAIIQDLGGMCTEEIFSLGGQPLYRRLERQALEQTIRQAIRQEGPVVLETGGSLVSETGTFRRLLEHFHTIWIEASPEEHMNRVIAQGDLRPMRNNDEAMEDLRRILAAREPLYRTAHARLNTSGKSFEESLESLTTLCQASLTGPRSGDKEAAIAT